MPKSGFIAIAGRPNSGKSTLLNAVMGANLSIVSPKAQTTRERVLGILTEPEKGQIIFVDAPGIHRAKEDSINAYMMKEAKEALDDVSVVWYMVEPRSAPLHEEVVVELLLAIKAPILIIWNKYDVAQPSENLKKYIAGAIPKERIAGEFHISALRNKNIDQLLNASWPLLEEGPFHYDDPDQISDRPTRFFVAEHIRRQLFSQLGDELPYSCAVEIAQFKESTKPPRIEAVIHVERDSQKGMVIGAKGSKIRSIGEEARKEIQEFLGFQVFLGLQVEVSKDWTRNPRAMERLGYILPKTRP